jgi:hypothetical protein
MSGCTAYHPATSSLAAALALSSTNFNFKTVTVGQTATQTLHVSNSGSVPLQITGLSLPDAVFVISGPSVPRVILPNMSLDYTLSFTPTATGNATASLTITTNSANSVASVSLAGVGQKNSANADVQLSPSSFTFPSLALQTTATKSVTLQNTGETSVTLSGITVLGAAFGYSDLSPGFTLTPNQSVTFQVWFRPTVKGPASAIISILSANLVAPAIMALAGDGVASTTGTPPPTTPPTSTQHTVHLTWNAGSSNIAGYRVYRSQSTSGGLQSITSALVSSTDYDDGTVDSGTTYYYAVTDVDSSGDESGYSNEATAVVPSP